jgi:hypothetical protein
MAQIAAIFLWLGLLTTYTLVSAESYAAEAIFYLAFMFFYMAVMEFPERYATRITNIFKHSEGLIPVLKRMNIGLYVVRVLGVGTVCIHVILVGLLVGSTDQRPAQITALWNAFCALRAMLAVYCGSLFSFLAFMLHALRDFMQNNQANRPGKQAQLEKDQRRRFEKRLHQATYTFLAMAICGLCINTYEFLAIVFADRTTQLLPNGLVPDIEGRLFVYFGMIPLMFFGIYENKKVAKTFEKRCSNRRTCWMHKNMPWIHKVTPCWRKKVSRKPRIRLVGNGKRVRRKKTKGMRFHLARKPRPGQEHKSPGGPHRTTRCHVEVVLSGDPLDGVMVKDDEGNVTITIKQPQPQSTTSKELTKTDAANLLLVVNPLANTQSDTPEGASSCAEGMEYPMCSQVDTRNTTDGDDAGDEADPSSACHPLPLAAFMTVFPLS